MDPNCIFCKIVTGEAESSVVYDDPNVMAFMDLHPVNPGHTLIIPKRHSVNIYDTPTELLEKIVAVSKDLAIRTKEVVKADGVSIFQMNEIAGDQDVMHYHLHVIPRFKDDWFHEKIMIAVKKQSITNPTRGELDSLAAKIKANN